MMTTFGKSAFATSVNMTTRKSAFSGESRHPIDS
jgi:hypothetical protein